MFADVTFPLQVWVWPSAGTALGGASTCTPPTSPSARAGPQTYAEFILVRHTWSIWDGSVQLAAPKTASRSSCGCQAAKGTAQLMWNPHPRAAAAAPRHCCSAHTQNNQLWMECWVHFYRAQFYPLDCLWVPFRLSVWVWTWIENTWELLRGAERAGAENGCQMQISIFSPGCFIPSPGIPPVWIQFSIPLSAPDHIRIIQEYLGFYLSLFCCIPLPFSLSSLNRWDSYVFKTSKLCLGSFSFSGCRKRTEEMLLLTGTSVPLVVHQIPSFRTALIF